MRSLLLVCLLLSATVASLHAEESPWVVLVGDKAGDVWKTKLDKWVKADNVAIDEKNARRLVTKEGKLVLVNGAKGNAPDLITRESFGDVELEMEFFIPKGSNSGVKFQAVYEIQICDSHGRKDADLTGDSCGGVYPRTTLTPSYKHIDKGIAPKKNACKAPGAWQKLTAIFLTPRFDGDGKKTANAKLVKVTLNGETIHENVELKTPTGHNWTKKESPKGPIMLQGDHGPVAFRNVRVRAYNPK